MKIGRTTEFKLSKITKAWLAGFIDGEGYIGLTKKGERFQVIVRIGTTHRATMLYVSTLLGAPLYTDRKNKPNWKDCYITVIYDHRAELLLKSLLPYLITKREQVLAILEYRKTINSGNNQFNRAPVQVIQKRRDIYNRLRGLNKRGKCLI